MRLASVCYSRWIPLIISLIALLPVKGQGEGDQENSGVEEYFSGDGEKIAHQTSKKFSHPTFSDDEEEGSADVTLPPLSTCQRKRAEASKLLAEFRPQCDHDGSFKPVQCHRSTSQCWCVNADGEEIIGTIQQSPNRPKCPSESIIVVITRHPLLGKLPEKHTTEGDDIIIVESSTVSSPEPAVTVGKDLKPLPTFGEDENEVDEEEENETMEDNKTEYYFRDTFLSLFKDPLIFAGIIGGAVLALLCIVLLIMFTVYRMRKKDEGSYDLGEQGKTYSFGYTRAKDQEFFA